MRFSKVFEDVIEKGEKDFENISLIIIILLLAIIIPAYLYFYLP